MGTTVEIRVPRKYPKYCILLLEQLFTGSTSVTITKHFTEGQSGTFVLLVESTDRSGEPMLPAVVKIGPSHLLEEERHAAQTYMVDRLPDFVPISGALAAVTVKGPDGSSADYSAARYALAGNGIFTIETLREYALTASQDALWTVLERRLFQQFGQIWANRTPPQARRVGAAYDRVLPVNLRLEYTATAAEGATTLDGRHDPAGYPILKQNDWVKLDNFVITEIEAAERTLTLNLSQFDRQETGTLPSGAYRLRIHNVANAHQYQLNDMVHGLAGRVLTTRQSLLLSAVSDALPPTVDLTQPLLRLPASGVQLPNPLLQWSALLREELPMRIGTVHGDLNTGNVLVDVNAKSTFIIDCVHAHRDHALYDLVRLESEMVLHLVAARFFEQDLPPTAIYELYQWLDFVSKRDPNPPGFFAVPEPLVQQMPELQSVFVALTTIRNGVRHYLADPGQWREYYVALALTLIGALKFTTLDRVPAGMNPKAVAFWGAATLLAQLEQAVNLMHIGWQRVAVHEVAASTKSSGDGKPSVYVDQTTMRYDQRQGVFFEGNESVKIEGNVITGGTVNTANFHGPVTGPVHTGSGDIHIRSKKE